MNFDVIVVGGGPAGSTVAGILLRHRPQTRVLVLDRAHHPRFHIGETLVSEVNRILDELGVYSKIEQAGFIRKYGATFLWGADDRTWTMYFGELNDQAKAKSRFGETQTSWTWHVQRSRYDKILLDHAASLGADVREGCGVRELLYNAEGRVIGVRCDDGTEHLARFVIDATGQQGLGGSLADREMDPRLHNVAYSTFWNGWKRVPALTGTDDSSRTLTVALPHGWCWIFPVTPETASVGIVTSLEYHKSQRGLEPEQIFKNELAHSPELMEILANAELTPEPQGARVRVLTDFSYSSTSIVTPGLIRTGDAAGFVDPILSTGVFLAQSSARFLAYALRTILDGDAKIPEARALQAYEHQVRDTLLAFRELAWFYYRFNRRAGDWWAQARELVAGSAFPRVENDRAAFIAFATGFAAHGSVWREPRAAFDETFFLDLYAHFIEPGGSTRMEHAATDDRDVLCLIAEPILIDSAVPLDGEGLLAPSVRVEIPSASDSEGDRHTRRIHIPPCMVDLFPYLRGEHTLGAAIDAIAQARKIAPEHQPTLSRYVHWIASELLDRGLVKHQGRRDTEVA